MAGRFGLSVLVSAAMSISFAFFSAQALSQQSSQASPPGGDFVNRLATETERMQRQVRELSARVSALEAPAMAPSESDPQVQSPVTTNGVNNTRASELQGNGAVVAGEYERIKATLGAIDYKVVQERRRVDSAAPDDTDQQMVAVSNLRVLADELQNLEDVVARLEIASR